MLWRLVRVGFYMVAGLILCAVAFLAFVYLIGPPPMEGEENTEIFSKNETVIGVESGMENRNWVELDDMSEKVTAATVLIEDHHFYDHHGFDFIRIGGAIINNIRSGSLREGASTITQQLARNLYLTHEKTWIRKLKEAYYTVRLEMYYTKDEILEGYLNTIYYGHGAYGIEAASEYFFGKTQTNLSYAEAAMLVGIPKGPTYYSPFNNEENAEARKELILKRLWQEKIIDDATYHTAIRENLEYRTDRDGVHEEFAGHFQDMAVKEAAKILGVTEQLIRAGGYELYTTMDETVQEQVETAMKEIIPETTELESAVFSVDIHSGGVLALAGGRSYQTSEFNRVQHAFRMPGSSFKPFLYYAALENGFTSLTKLMSEPTTFRLGNGKVYEPGNFNHYYAYGPITLAEAIALSDNVYAVRTNLQLGVERFAQTAKVFGFEKELPAVPSLALGTASVTLEELVTAYGMLGNGGKELETYTIEKITDKNGRVLYERENESLQQVLNERTSFILTQLLAGIFEPKLNGYMPVTGSTISDQLTRIYAGKSGTTKADNWMIGYSPSIATGVWTGYDDHRDITAVQETTYAKEIWARVMEKAHEGEAQENFPMPNGVVGVPIDLETGLRATPYCGENLMMYFEKGTEPVDYCEPTIAPEPEDENPDDGLFKKWFDLLFE
ncbi:transglycosylase domain-containing protein [Oceanobacillus alkalisoli]|uniref:transglycosylase domain-containing protein n=1 Tax=Oceanobacillus alkalisoli TaxID=2925113 RepID=UPI001F11F77F|nr:transglycosylase domain-containing protein [Oceanobacillus alkalisoli]MCF3942771.1 penicillin-binding protein [Oceanobacillus alkalisoli]